MTVTNLPITRDEKGKSILHHKLIHPLEIDLGHMENPKNIEDLHKEVIQKTEKLVPLNFHRYGQALIHPGLLQCFQVQ